MNLLPITTQQVMRVVLIFVLVIVGFGVLSATIGWPDKQSWGLVIFAALALALLPILSPLLNFLRESRAIIDIHGVKLDFSGAPRLLGTEPRRANLDEQPGVAVTDSNAASIADATATAAESEIVVVNLGTGRSWYPSRLFALAAAVEQHGSTKVIVLLAQRGGVDRQFVGWLQPSGVVRAMIQHDSGYFLALNRAKAMLRHLQLYADVPGHVFPIPFNFANQLKTAYSETGDLAFVPALIRELQQPKSATDPDPSIKIEDTANPTWLTRDDVERLFDPWLIRTSLPVGGGDQQTLAMLARLPHRFIAVEENDRYVGMVDIDAFVRQVVLQQLEVPKSS